MGFKDYVKSKLKYLVGIATCAAIVSQLVLPIVGTKASTPRFNFMAGDYEMLKGANVSNNETVWKDPVSGIAGDEFRAQVYYHNGMIDTVAQNTKIKVNIPSKTTNKTAKISATISADNAGTITDTVVDGNVIGPNGLTANFSEDVDLEYIPGSTKWFPNATPVGGASTFFPNGQSGDEIVNTNGVNIGDIQGCWNYAGFVIFGFKAKRNIVHTPALELTKEVLNVSKNEVSFHDHSVADNKDELIYQIVIRNGGNSDLSNLIVSDVLPAGVNFVPGSMQKFLDGSTTPIALSDANANAVFGQGFNIGTLGMVSAGGQIVLRFKATVDTNEAICKEAINRAIATGEGLRSEDTAIVTICAQEKIVKSKSAFNQTKNQVATVASAGDIIEYTLTTKNSGDLAVNFVVEDGIADVLEYSDIVSISDNGVIVAGTTGNEAQMVRYPTTHIEIGQTVVRKFVVKVKNPLPTYAPSGYHYDDRMYNFYGNEVLIKIERETIKPTPSPTPAPKPVTPSTPAKQLPVTGSATGASFIITFMAGLGLTYLRYRKLYDPSTGLIISDLLAK